MFWQRCKCICVCVFICRFCSFLVSWTFLFFRNRKSYIYMLKTSALQDVKYTIIHRRFCRPLLRKSAQMLNSLWKAVLQRLVKLFLSISIGRLKNVTGNIAWGIIFMQLHLLASFNQLFPGNNLEFIRPSHCLSKMQVKDHRCHVNP